MLIPFFTAEVLPGDTFNVDATIFARLNTPVFPIMTNVWLDVQWWFCPLRLVWEHTQNFFGEQVSPSDTTDYLTPISVIPVGGYAVHSLQDYLDLPVVQSTPALTSAGAAHTVFLTRMYNLLWNQSYRDQNLQDPVVVDTDDGPDDPADYVLLPRGKRHDYFTACLPWAQKGDPVSISLAGNVPVTVNSTTGVHGWNLKASNHTRGDSTAGTGGPYGSGITGYYDAGSGVHGIYAYQDTFGVYTPALYDPNGTLEVNLSSSSSITINAFRQAYLQQEMLELDARSGTRYPGKCFWCL